MAFLDTQSIEAAILRSQIVVSPSLVFHILESPVPIPMEQSSSWSVGVDMGIGRGINCLCLSSHLVVRHSRHFVVVGALGIHQDLVVE